MPLRIARTVDWGDWRLREGRRVSVTPLLAVKMIAAGVVDVPRTVSWQRLLFLALDAADLNLVERGA